MYKEQHITKEQYQEIIFVLAEKQPVFYSRMSKPHFWSSEKKAAMLEMLHDVEPEDHDLVPIEHPYENQRSPKIVPFPIKKFLKLAKKESLHIKSVLIWKVSSRRFGEGCSFLQALVMNNSII